MTKKIKYKPGYRSAEDSKAKISTSEVSFTDQISTSEDVPSDADDIKMNSFLYLSLCMSALFVCVFSLSCMPCDEVKCKTPTCKKGVGIVKSACGCCDTCAKTEHQACGGPWNLKGFCDSGLSCVVRLNGKIIKQRGFSFLSGRCEPKKCSRKNCHINQKCTVMNDRAVCECPRQCKNKDKPVCGLTNGVEYENECQFRRYECKLGKKIGFKNGPCKRCFMPGGKPYKFGEVVRKGQCESCSCYHGSWKCKNTCAIPAVPEPLIAPDGARCDLRGRKIRCGPGMICKPNPNQSKRSRFGVCTFTSPEPISTESFPTPAPLPVCPLRKCKPCKYGYILDENNCQTCECRTKKSPCNLPKNPGPCYAYIPRYYFNPKVGKCMKFIFGGCKANANNFKSRKSCERKCLV